MDNCNFQKAIGEDGFDGAIFNLSPEVKLKVAQDILGALNACSLPEYL
jgi:hypothetical protein